MDKQSATLGLPGTRERQIGLEGNHSDICKFEDPKGDDWELVSGRIIKMAEDAIKSEQDRTQLQELGLTPSRNQLLPSM